MLSIMEFYDPLSTPPGLKYIGQIPFFLIIGVFSLLFLNIEDLLQFFFP